MSKRERDLYSLLGYSFGDRDNLTLEHIKRGFKVMSLLHHPDKGGDSKRFTALNHAFDVLKNIEKRAFYDKYGVDCLSVFDNEDDFEYNATQYENARQRQKHRSKPQADAKAESDSESERRPNREHKAQSVPKAKAKADAEPERRSNRERKPQAEPTSVPKAKAKAYAKAKAKADANADAEDDSTPEPDPKEEKIKQIVVGVLLFIYIIACWKIYSSS